MIEIEIGRWDASNDWKICWIRKNREGRYLIKFNCIIHRKFFSVKNLKFQHAIVTLVKFINKIGAMKISTMNFKNIVKYEK